MKRLYILCEGQTEEEFVNAILNPYWVLVKRNFFDTGKIRNLYLKI